MSRILSASAIAFVSSLSIVAFCQTFTDLRVWHQLHTYEDSHAGSFVGLQSVAHQRIDAPNGGPQALEGYTRLEHDRGRVAMAFGTIGNVEMNSHAAVDSVRSLQAGGVVSNDGEVSQWSDLSLQDIGPMHGYTGSVHVKRFDYITFGNGWSIRPTADGKGLLLCDARSVCRSL